MKNLTLILFVVFVFSLNCGYSQNNRRSPLTKYSRKDVYAVPTKRESISMVKESYHFAYFSNPADSVANIDRFIATINRIVPMGNEKSETIKNQALSAVRSSDILTLNDQFYNLAFNVEEHISLMGTNVIDVIRDNFDESEFAILYKAMDSERRWALHAYGVLLVLSKKESPELKGADKDVPNSKLYEHWLNQTFDYYNIRWD